VGLAGAAIAGATAVGHVAGANATTTGFLFLIVVLGVAVARGLVAGTLASLAGTVAFNYFFLPPAGTLSIADPSNWVALGAFLVASTVASRLVAQARRRAAEADARRAEVEALYDLSVDLFTATNRVGALGLAAGRALRTIGAAGGGLLLFRDGPGAPEVVFDVGGSLRPDDPLVDAVGRNGETVEVPAAGFSRDVYLPLGVGGKPSGVLVARGTRAERTALESVGRLVALAVERERFLGERTAMEALRESESLKTSLLRAVSHDLRTPLTAIRLGLERLRRTGGGLEGVDEVARETERLSRRIDNLLAMARLDAGTFRPKPEPAPAADLFRAAMESLSLVMEGRPVAVSISPETPDLLVDPALAVEILSNLLENAARVSPGGATIELCAAPDPSDARRVRLTVLDRGPGVPAAVKQAAGGRDGGDTGRAGLGLEICRSLTRALGGSMSLADRPGGGTVARVDLPAAGAEA
jgi:two-component system, OmpR family, sensor histidine kinase KdpD